MDDSFKLSKMYVCLFCFLLVGFSSIKYIDCLSSCDPPSIQNATFSPTSTEYQFDDVVTVTCDSGTRFNDSDVTNHLTVKNFTCDRNAMEFQWHGYSISSFECIAIDCGEPDCVENSYVVLPDFTTTGNIVTYMCDVGYMFADGGYYKEMTCGASSNWTISDTSFDYRCSDCPAPPVLSNATVQENLNLVNRTVGNILTYNCSDGFEFPEQVSSRQYRCNETKAWVTTNDSLSATEGQFGCQRKDCGSPPCKTNGISVIENDYETTYQGVVTYSCFAGYRINGYANGTLECDADGRWSIVSAHHAGLKLSEFQCTEVDCGLPSNFTNAMLLSTGTTLNSTVSYTCSPGYVFNNSEISVSSVEMRCMTNGRWEYANSSHSYNSCQPIDCGTPREIQNTTYHIINSTTLGGTVRYMCSDGYKFNIHGRDVLYGSCSAEGIWLAVNNTNLNTANVFCELETLTVVGTAAPQATAAEYTTAAGIDDTTLGVSSATSSAVPVTTDGVTQTSSAGVSQATDGPTTPDSTTVPVTADGVTHATSAGVSQATDGPTTPDSTTVPVTADGVTQTTSAGVSQATDGPTTTDSSTESGTVGGETLSTSVGVSQTNEPSTVSSSHVTSTIQPTTATTLTPGAVTQDNSTVISPTNGVSESTMYSNSSLSDGATSAQTQGSAMNTTSVLPETTTSQASVSCPPNGCSSGGSATQSDNPGVTAAITENPTSETNTVDTSNPVTTETQPAPTEIESVTSTSTETTASSSTEQSRTTPNTQNTTVNETVTTTVEPKNCSAGPDWVRYTDTIVDGTSPGDRAMYVCTVGVKFTDGTTSRSVVCQPDGTWEQLQEQPAYVTCEEFGTETSPLPPGVVMQKEGILPIYDSRRIFTCQTDTARFSDGMIRKEAVCSSNGQWSCLPTSCQEQRCVPATFVPNANMTGTSVDRDAIINFKCSVGHSFSDGTTSRSGQCTGGAWDINADKCSKNFCPWLPVPTHGSLSTFKMEYQTVVEVKCDIGHIMSDLNISKTVECLATQNWTGSYSNCTAVKCDASPLVSYAVPTEGKNTNGLNYGATVLYECDKPTKAKFEDGTTEKTIKCTEYQRWNDSNFACSPTRCVPVPTIDHATPDRTMPTDFGTQIIYTCDPGYRFSDGTYEPKNATCLHTGEWDTTGLNCTEILCEDPLNVTNGRKNSDSIKFGTNVTIICDKGYQINGRSSDSTYCNVSEKWEPSLPPCDAIRCRYPYHLPSVRDRAPQTYGYIQTFSCPPGMWFGRDKLTHPARCGNSDGSWINGIPLCTDITCPTIPTWEGIQFNRTSDGVYLMNTVVNYTCTSLPEGHVNKGDYLISTCSEIGQWSPSIICYDNSTIDRDKTTVDADGSIAIGTVIISCLISFQALIVASEFPLMGMQIYEAFNNIRYANFWK